MIDFPNTPTIGDEYEGFVWDGVAWVAPASPQNDPPLPNKVTGSEVVPAPYEDINFPPNPNVGDRYTYQSTTWEWGGTAWRLLQYVPNSFVGLTDTPNTFAGSGGFLVMVQSDEKALYFQDLSVADSPLNNIYVPKVGGWQHPFQSDLYITDLVGDISTLYFVSQEPQSEEEWRLGSLDFNKVTGVGTINLYDGTIDSAQTTAYRFQREDLLAPGVIDQRSVLTIQTGVSKFLQSNQIINGGNLHIEKSAAALHLRADTATNPQLFWRSTANGIAFDEWNALLQNWDGRLTLRYNGAVSYVFDTDPSTPSASGVLRRDTADARYIMRAGGVSGSFTTTDNKTVTVVDGQITGIA